MGMLSIFFAIESQFTYACVAIFIAALLDCFDGRLARKYEVSNELGKELDSLADLITFGVAPTVLSYILFFQSFGLLGMLISSLITISGAIRLARFNAYMYKDTKNFTGIPITLSGLLIAFILLFFQFKIVPYTILIITLSYLMNSKVKIPTFKETYMKSN